MGYGLSAVVDRPFDQTVADVREALAAEGFGVLTEIDVKATLKAKIDVDIDEQLILGACNPRYAHRALQAEPAIGLLLPCNVVVRTTSEGTVVEMIDPQMMVELTENPQMAAVADEVAAALGRALDAVKA